MSGTLTAVPDTPSHVLDTLPTVLNTLTLTLFVRVWGEKTEKEAVRCDERAHYKLLLSDTLAAVSDTLATPSRVLDTLQAVLDTPSLRVRLGGRRPRKKRADATSVPSSSCSSAWGSSANTSLEMPSHHTTRTISTRHNPTPLPIESEKGVGSRGGERGRVRECRQSGHESHDPFQVLPGRRPTTLLAPSPLATSPRPCRQREREKERRREGGEGRRERHIERERADNQIMSLMFFSSCCLKGWLAAQT